MALYARAGEIPIIRDVITVDLASLENVRPSDFLTHEPYKHAFCIDGRLLGIKLAQIGVDAPFPIFSQRVIRNCSGR